MGRTNHKTYEKIEQIALAELYPPEFNPFQVNDDGAMQRLTESIKQSVHSPAVCGKGINPRRTGRTAQARRTQGQVTPKLFTAQGTRQSCRRL